MLEQLVEVCRSTNAAGRAMRALTQAEFDMLPAKGSTKGSTRSVTMLPPSDLRGVVFANLQLRGAIFAECDFRGCDMRGCHLPHANLSSADLSGADLTGVDLDRTNFSGACLRGATLRAILGTRVGHTCAASNCGRNCEFGATMYCETCASKYGPEHTKDNFTSKQFWAQNWAGADLDGCIVDDAALRALTLLLGAQKTKIPEAGWISLAGLIQEPAVQDS